MLYSHPPMRLIWFSLPGRFRGSTSVTDAPADLKALYRLDPEAISAVHDRYFPELFRYARYRLGDETLAEDVASEAFVALLEALQARKGPRSNLRGWLMRVASNRIADLYREQYNKPADTLPVGTADEPAAESLEAEIDRGLLLHQALDQLTDEQQHVIALRFGSGLTHEEVALLLGKNINAVKQLQFRALKSLRGKVEGLGS